jgi:hypothetical protein
MVKTVIIILQLMQKPLLNGVSTHLNLMVVMKILIISMISSLKWVKLSTNQVIKYSYERDRELNERNSWSNAILYNNYFCDHKLQADLWCTYVNGLYINIIRILIQTMTRSLNTVTFLEITAIYPITGVVLTVL